MIRIKIYWKSYFFLAFVFLHGCTKLTQVPEPVNTITTTETFGTDATATSAIIGIYNDFLNNYYANGFLTQSLGMSADELHFFGGGSSFETNTYTANNSDTRQFWSSAYYDIYLANAAIEALPKSSVVSEALKKQLTGEAKFFRAFFHFYLVNLFGDIPIVISTAYRNNDTIRRSPSAEVYNQIAADLKDAQQLLAPDYSISGGERVRVNQASATALLARVYLYEQKWDSAETEASQVIANTDLYELLDNLTNVFLANSREAIFQLQIPDRFPYATNEGDYFIPLDSTSNPYFYLTDELLGSFEDSDQRRAIWVDSINFFGTTYYYPFKYKVLIGTQGNIAEYYMVLRLAEQYLIRAEARAEQNELDGAIADINIIRERAKLHDLPNSLSRDETLAAIYKERRIEFFAEWGHRWLDLKRTQQADGILSSLKPTWKPFAALYPIPPPEIIDDANLTQNPGY